MKKEKLTTCCICGEMSRSRWKDGKEYYYILDYPSPLEELKKVLSEGA